MPRVPHDFTGGRDHRCRDVATRCTVQHQFAARRPLSAIPAARILQRPGEPSRSGAIGLRTLQSQFTQGPPALPPHPPAAGAGGPCQVPPIATVRLRSRRTSSLTGTGWAYLERYSACPFGVPLIGTLGMSGQTRKSTIRGREGSERAGPRCRSKAALPHRRLTWPDDIQRFSRSRHRKL